MSEMIFTAAIARTIAEEMRRDPDVFVMGEDVGVIGGIYGASKGLLKNSAPSAFATPPFPKPASLAPVWAPPAPACVPSWN